VQPVQPATTPTSTGGPAGTTTAGITTPPLPLVPPPPGSPASGITGCVRAVTVGTNGTVKLCDASNPPTASTTQTLSVVASSASAARRKKKARTIGSGRTTIPTGQTRPVIVKLSASGKRLLKAKRSLTVSATILAVGVTGTSETLKRTVTLKPAKRKRARR
jgi:hypothetical protein